MSDSAEKRVKELIDALDTSDNRAQRAAGDELLSIGQPAADTLALALENGPADTRKAAAFLLGRIRGSHRSCDSLARAVLEDPEPKVRKNAVVSLGKLGLEVSVEPLVLALKRERVSWVRSSIVLALGAVGGGRAREALADTSPVDDREAEALRKALDRLRVNQRTVSWRDPDRWTYESVLDVPEGMERVALSEATERGISSVRYLSPGRLIVGPESPPWRLLSTLRCVQGVAVWGGAGAPIDWEETDKASEKLISMLAASRPLADVHEWVESENEALRYRFSLDGAKISRKRLRALLEVVRAVCLPLGLVDSPSNYDLELVVSSGPAGPELLIRPAFMEDMRFAYRQRDVGASIQTSIAACLARLARVPRPDTVVFDPTCGSGTLLVERAMLGGCSRLIGADISRTAISAARANIVAAGLSDRAQIYVADAAQLDSWPVADEIVANLPFGVRTRRGDADLERLYATVITNTGLRLRPGGRAVFYTASRRLFERQLARHGHGLKVVERLHTRAGGLHVHVWMLTPS